MRTVTGRRGRARIGAAALAGGVALMLAVAGCVSAPSATDADTAGSAVAGARDSGPAGSVDPARITYLTSPPAPASGGTSGETVGSSGAGDDPAGAGSSTADHTSGDAGSADGTAGAVSSESTLSSASSASSASSGSSAPPESSGSSEPSTPPTSPASQKPKPPASTSFTGVNPQVSTTYGAPVSLNFGLVSGHRAVPDASATVSYADHTATVRLNGEGRGSAQLSGLPIGTTAVHLRYAGDARHRPTSTEVTVSVARRHTDIQSLVVAGSSVTVNQTVTVDVGDDITIGFDVVSGGQPVAQQKGTIAYDSTEKTVSLDADGHASFTLSGLPAGQHQVIVRYAGDKTREGAGAPFTVSVIDPKAQQSDGDANDGDSQGSQQNPDNPCPVFARACVDLSNNTTWLQSGGQIVYGPVPMLSGRPGYRTPSGTFQVYWKDKDHLSTIFDDAPMPNSVFFVGGVAFHEGSLSVTSHGCIHLSWEASEQYWDFLNNGDTVSVFGYAPY